jgi:tRNA threonylcarbamoyladenosine biosynthesis protein TsaB
VAQGLGFGARVPVLAVDTLLAVAEEARLRSGATRWVAVLDARMEEVYSAGYEHDGAQWHERQAPALGRPEQVVLPEGWGLAGNALALYRGRLPAAKQELEALPTASALLRLAPALLAAGRAQDAAQALPLYIRDKVAQTTEERAALRGAAADPI